MTHRCCHGLSSFVSLVLIAEVRSRPEVTQRENSDSSLRNRERSNPASFDGVLDQVRISVDQPSRGRLDKLPPLRLRLRGDRDRPCSFEEPSAGIGPLPMEHLNMAHDLSLAQSHAFHLCNDLMVPITLFKSGDEFGVLPSDELDDEDDLEIVHEYFPRGSH